MRLVTGRRSKYAVLLVFVLFAGALASQSGKLSEVTSSELAETLPDGAESLEVVEASDAVGDDVSPAIVVYHRAEGLSQGDRRRIADDRARLEADPPPLAVGVGATEVEEDTALIAVPLRVSSDNDATGEAVQALRERVVSTEGEGAGLQVAVTGGAAFSADISSVFEGVDTTLLAITGSIVLVLLVLIYRSPIFWVDPVLRRPAHRGRPRAVPATCIGQAGVTITGQGTGILIVLVFGTGTDYALLLVARYREELARHEDPARGNARRPSPGRPDDPRLRRHGDRRLCYLLLARSRQVERIPPGSRSRSRRRRGSRDGLDV